MIILSCITLLAFLWASEHKKRLNVTEMCIRTTGTTGTAARPIVLDVDEEVKPLTVQPARNERRQRIDLTLDDVVEHKARNVVERKVCNIAECKARNVAERKALKVRSKNLSAPSIFINEPPSPLYTNESIADLLSGTEPPSDIILTSPTVSQENQKALRDEAKPNSLNITCHRETACSQTSVLRKRPSLAPSPQEPIAKKQKLNNITTFSHTYPMGYNWKDHQIQIEANNRLVVFNLSQNTGIPELLKTLRVFGSVEEIEYVDDSQNCRTNFAFARFTSRLALANAVSLLRNKIIDGNTIGVDECLGTHFDPKARTIEVLIPAKFQADMGSTASLFLPETWASRYMHVVEHHFNPYMMMGTLTFNTIEDALQTAKEMVSYGFIVLGNSLLPPLLNNN